MWMLRTRRAAIDMLLRDESFKYFEYMTQGFESHMTMLIWPAGGANISVGKLYAERGASCSGPLLPWEVALHGHQFFTLRCTCSVQDIVTWHDTVHIKHASTLGEFSMLAMIRNVGV